MSNKEKALAALQQEIASQKDRSERIRQLEHRRELLSSEIEEGATANAADYETKRKALLERFVDGEIDQKQFGAASRELEKERISVPNQKELLTAIDNRKLKENDDHTAARHRITELQDEYRDSVFDSTIAALKQKPGFVKALKNLVVLANVCQRDENSTIEDFINLTTDELPQLIDDFENSDLLLARF